MKPQSFDTIRKVKVIRSNKDQLPLINPTDPAPASRKGKHKLRVSLWFLIPIVAAIILIIISWPVIRPVYDLYSLIKSGHNLILFQNNAELRGGGGFLGTFAVVENRGIDIRRYYFEANIYKKDNDFTQTTKIPPPDFFTQGFKSEIPMAMRDSNYSADFKLAAENVNRFYQLEYGKKADGIVAINASVLRDLLRLTGPIKVEGLADPVTADNFFDLTQKQIQESYFENQTNKQINEPKNVLKEMVGPLISKIKSVSPIDLYNFGMRQIQTKQILFWFDDGRQETVERNNWGGRISDWSNESLFVSNSNIGGEKTSLNVDESMIISGDSRYSPERNLVYIRQHSGQSGYQTNVLNENYSRIYLPMGTVIKEVKMDSRLLSASDYKISEEGNRLVLGLWTTVSPHQTLEVDVTYLLSQSKLGDKLLFQKQPGVISNGLQVIFGNENTFQGQVNQDTII